jgi:hypothetical protein
MTAFEHTSRYFELKTLTYTTPGGREIAYTARRFLPNPTDLVLLVEHTVTEGERLDHITARYLGDPEQFWRLCDINNALNPEDLLEVGRKLHISVPQS